MDRAGLSDFLDDLERRGMPESLREEVEARLLTGAREDVGPDWPPLDAARYQLGPLLGQGGMGRVYLLEDTLLDRRLAWKEPVRTALAARLGDEARVAAGLVHPGIPPVHDVGALAGRGPGYTMRLLDHHVPLTRVIEGLHRGHDVRRAVTTVAGGAEWSLRRVVEALRQVADTLAFAHQRGVVHRDVKPENILVGGFDEVYLVDWGLVKVVEPSDERRKTVTETQVGLGSPLYMAPERWEGAAPEPSWDVYALGLTLFVLLLGPQGEVPASGARAASLDALVALHPGLEELAALVLASTGAAAARPSAAGWARAAVAWLDGSARRARAEHAWAAARSLDASTTDLHQRVTELAAAMEVERAGVTTWSSPAQKADLYALEDQHRDCVARLRQGEEDYVNLLHVTLAMDASFEPARSALDTHLIARHRSAVRHLRAGEAAVAEALLRASDSPVARRYLDEPPRLSVETVPAGVPVAVRPIREAARRWRVGPPDVVATTPLRSLPLAPGSCLVEVGDVRYPIVLRHGEQWAEPALEVRGPAQSGAVWVPAGPFLAGSVTAAFARPPSRVWVDSFQIQRLPVTNADYIAFLQALRERTGAGVDHPFVPRVFSFNPRELGAPVYGYSEESGFFLDPALTPGWELGHPVVYVTWDAAVAYAAWFAEVTGLPWRLPFELEWEKAARGVDGRTYPWGDTFDHSFACVQGSRAPGEETGPVVALSQEFEADESPYGVRHLAGNTVDWCLDPWSIEGPLDPATPWREVQPADEHAYRGGHWYSEARPLAHRGGFSRHSRVPTTGIRLVCGRT